MTSAATTPNAVSTASSETGRKAIFAKGHREDSTTTSQLDSGHRESSENEDHYNHADASPAVLRTPMRFVWGAATHQGMIRQNNEDSLFPDSSGESNDTAVLMVADGMGGHIAGEVASRLAVNAAASSDSDPADRVAAGNRAIREQVAREQTLEGMGTTLTLVSLNKRGTATFGHVGDSRAYLYRSQELRQLTQDHTVAAEYVALGEIEAEEADTHPQRHILTRALGLTRFIDVDEFEVQLEVSDRILLCSDGLNEMVSSTEIEKALSGMTTDEVAWRLIEMANENGGVDNITVIVIDVLE